MAIWSNESANSKELVIKVQGRFDFSAHQEFRDAYEKSRDKPECYVVDMKEATYLDSSALGMLLLLRDHAGGDNSQINIINCNSEVKKILTISNFEQLFGIA